MKKNENPYKGFFEKLSHSFPEDLLKKLVITDDESSEDYNKTYLQKVDEYLEQQYDLINKLYSIPEDNENVDENHKNKTEESEEEKN